MRMPGLREQRPVFEDEVLGLSPTRIRDLYWVGAFTFSHSETVSSLLWGRSLTLRRNRSFDYAACLNDKLTGERKSNGVSRDKVYVENKRCRKLDGELLQAHTAQQLVNVYGRAAP